MSLYLAYRGKWLELKCAIPEVWTSHSKLWFQKFMAFNYPCAK
jgi:hypothetical protein